MEVAVPLESCIESNHTAYREFVICGICSGTFSIFGLFANIISFIVYRHRRLKGAPINWYFTVLSVSDFFLCATSFLIFSVRPFAVYSQNPQWISISREATVFLYPLSLICQSCSVWITVSVAVYRFLGICFPLKTLHIVTSRYVKVNITAVAVSALLYNLPRFFEIRTILCQRYDGTYMRTLEMTSLRLFEPYKIGYVNIAYNIFMFGVPMVTLTSVNACIIRALRSSGNFKRRSYAYPTASVSRSGVHTFQLTAASPTIAHAATPSSTPGCADRKVSVMLVVLVFFFLACNVIPLLSNMAEIILSKVEFVDAYAEQYAEDVYHILVDLGNLMATVNSSMNIVIYYFYGQHFKGVLQKFVKVYIRCDKREARFDRIPTVGALSASSMRRTGTVIRQSTLEAEV